MAIGDEECTQVAYPWNVNVGDVAAVFVGAVLGRRDGAGLARRAERLNHVRGYRAFWRATLRTIDAEQAHARHMEDVEAEVELKNDRVAVNDADNRCGVCKHYGVTCAFAMTWNAHQYVAQ